MPILDYKQEIAYRRPLDVYAFTHHGGYTYPLCPKCKCALDREYMAYCDQCGQKLKWSRYILLQEKYPEKF